jgi:type IV secretory pathway TrbD component
MARLAGLIVTFFCGLAWRSWVPDGFGFVFPLMAIAGWTVMLARQDDWLRRAAFLRPG